MPYNSSKVSYSYTDELIIKNVNSYTLKDYYDNNSIIKNTSF